jgi:hypothetical protein
MCLAWQRQITQEGSGTREEEQEEQEQQEAAAEEGACAIALAFIHPPPPPQQAQAPERRIELEERTQQMRLRADGGGLESRLTSFNDWQVGCAVGKQW